MAPPTPSWVILGSMPRVSATDADLPPGADFSLALAPPPRVSLLTIPTRIFPEAAAPRNIPSVVAADHSGHLLLHANQGRATGPTVVDRPGCYSFAWLEFVAGYFVLDAASAPASALPLPNPEFIVDRGSLGIIAAPGGGHYMVAEFQPIVGSSGATLLCFSSETGEWVEKKVHNPLPRWMWTFHDVVSHCGKLWWVDRVAGLLACDPFTDEPAMDYVPLPKGDVQHDHGQGCSYCSKRKLGTRRCVQLSNGKFRCVEMSCASSGVPKISMRTLADPGTAEWALEYEASFAEIWAGESYKVTGLPEKVPVIALVHPKNPDVVYFFLDKHLIFGVDLRARRLVECEAHELVMPRGCPVSSSCVLPWEPPVALSAGLLPKDTGSGSNEESASPALTAPSVSHAQEAPSRIKLCIG